MGTKGWCICVGVVEGKGRWFGRYSCCLRKEVVCRVDSLRGWWKVVQLRGCTLRFARVWVKGGMVVTHAVFGCGAGSYLV